MKPTRLSTITLFAFSLITACALAQTATQPQTQPDKNGPKDKDDAKLVYVLMTTSKGDIALELNREKAPITVANFLAYTDKKFYDGTIFHRIMKTFMIQGGGFTEDGKQKPTDKTIKNEWQNGLKNTRGTIAMARIGGNPDSASSQFFINVADNAVLDQARDGAAYAVFGKVVAGMDVVDQIRNVPVGPDARGEPSKPTEIITIEKVKRLTPDEAKKLIDAEKSASQSN